MPTRRPRTGELSYRVTIERVTRTRDSVGGWAETWPTPGDPNLPQVWANIVPLSGDEAIFADQVGGRVTHQITIHHRSDLTTKDRVRFTNGASVTRIFNIVHIQDFEGLGERTELFCVEQV